MPKDKAAAGFYGGGPGYAFGPDIIQYNEGTLKVDLSEPFPEITNEVQKIAMSHGLV